MSGRQRTEERGGVRYSLAKRTTSRDDRQTEVFYVPGLSCERGVHRGGRSVHQRIGCARREKGLIEVAREVIKRTKREENV
jgi:hypothetical protein